MAEETNGGDSERELLVQCIEDAFDAIRIMPGVDENGPVLVWLADHLWQARSRSHQAA
jgi:hypothetical protein